MKRMEAGGGQDLADIEMRMSAICPLPDNLGNAAE
jgi:hypothetical protein